MKHSSTQAALDRLNAYISAIQAGELRPRTVFTNEGRGHWTVEIVDGLAEIAKVPPGGTRDP